MRFCFIAAWCILIALGVDAFADELSSCASSAKPLECYTDFILKHGSEKSADDALSKVVALIESAPSEKEEIAACDKVIQKIGKYYISYLPPKLRFYMSGPAYLEIFRLIELKNQGVPDVDLIKVVLSARGAYEQIGRSGNEVLVKNGFSPLLIKVLANYSFLKLGDKTNISNLRMIVNGEAPEEDKLEIIAMSNIKNVQINLERGELLSELGFSKEQIKVLKYNQFLRNGPSDYPIWSVVHDQRNNMSSDAISKKIVATGMYYPNFNENEIELVSSFGVSSEVINAMQNQSKAFFAGVAQVAKATEKRNAFEDLTYDKSLTYTKAYQKSDPIYNGVKQESSNDVVGSVAAAVGECVGREAALKACDKIPSPFNYACTALAKNTLCTGGAVKTIVTAAVSPAEANPVLPPASTIIAPNPIEGNTGRYMCPFTSDGVLAKWTDKAVNAKLGRSVGSMAGSYIGRKVGEKALSAISGGAGGSIGEELGAKIGSEGGRMAAVAIAGGEEFIRKSSDLSFSNVDDMARYIYANFSSTNHYKVALESTMEVYPELKERYFKAVASAARK